MDNMKRLVVVVLLLLGLVGPVAAVAAEDPYEDDIFSANETNGNDAPLADPLEPVNRFFFEFNDRLYFWILKPVATGYANVVAEDIRMCVRDFFHNLLTPVRLVNNLLQGKVQNSGVELARFAINSTLGVAGLGDPAKTEFGLSPKDEDLGQTLGVYGAGEGFYICWPILGPSSLRDTVGLVGDSFLNPISYLMASDFPAGAGAYGGRQVNASSLTLGEYEQFKAAAFDPYLAVRDAYRQYRRNKVKDATEDKNGSIYSEEDGVGQATTRMAAADDLFFIHVGSFDAPEAAEEQRTLLLAMNMPASVTVHDRIDYAFYGVLIPAGNDFEAAKRREAQLVAAGFPEAVVISR